MFKIFILLLITFTAYSCSDEKGKNANKSGQSSDNLKQKDTPVGESKRKVNEKIVFTHKIEFEKKLIKINGKVTDFTILPFELRNLKKGVVNVAFTDGTPASSIDSFIYSCFKNGEDKNKSYHLSFESGLQVKLPGLAAYKAALGSNVSEEIVIEERPVREEAVREEAVREEAVREEAVRERAVRERAVSEERPVTKRVTAKIEKKNFLNIYFIGGKTSVDQKVLTDENFSSLINAENNQIVLHFDRQVKVKRIHDFLKKINRSDINYYFKLRRF